MLLVLVGTTNPQQAQPASALKFQHLNIQDGLISPLITDVKEDQYGFLWISTFSGLSRFDGTEFTNYHADNGPCSLANSHISQIEIGLDSNVYLLTGDSWSILDVQQQCFHNFQIDTTFSILSSQFLQSIFPDSGVVWFGTGVGLAKYHLEEKTYTHFFAPPNEEMAIPARTRIRHIQQHPTDPNRLILALEGGLCYFLKSESKFEYSIPMADAPYWWRSLPRTLHVFDASTYWNGWWANGLGQYDVQSEQWTFYYTEKGMRHVDPARGNVPYDVGQAVLPYDEKHVLVGFDRGLGVLSTDNGDIQLYQHDPNDPTSVSNNDVVALERTKSDVIYIGTSNGLSVLDDANNSIQRYNPRDHLEQVYSQTQQDPGLVDLVFYCARVPISDHELLYSDAVTGGVTIVDFEQTQFEHLSLGQEDNRSIVFYESATLPDGRLLLGSNRGIHLFNPKTKSKETLPEPISSALKSGRFFRPKPILAPNGDLFIWDTRQLTRIDDDSTIHPIRSQWLTDEPLITCVYGDGRNELIVWLADRAFRTQGDTLHPFKLSELQATRVSSGFKDGNTIWAGTAGTGLYQYEVRNDSLILISHLTTQNGLPSNEISRLTPTKDNTIWGSSLSGVFRLDLDGLYVRAFDLRDGVDLPYIDEPPVILPDGSVVFDDRKYLYRLVSEEQQEQSAQAYIQALEFPDSTYFNLTESIALPPGQNTVTIEMGIIDHVSGPRDELYYWLEGFDNSWQKSGKDRNARYTNLGPGNYRAKVRARNSEGVYSAPVFASFVIRPALYQRAWFIPALIILALSAIYFWYKTRIQSLKRAERIRMQHSQKVAELELKALRSQMNPHFMFNSLNSIKNYILQAEPRKASEYLSSFAHLIRLTLQHSREKSISLQEELDALLLYIDLEKLRFRSGFEFNCTVDDSINLAGISIPPMILQPYVENAIWHGLLHKEGERQLSLNFNRSNGVLHCTIEDNGIGREKAMEMKSKSATRYKSMGMGITRGRVDILNQINKLGIELEIIDKEDINHQPTGTRVDIKIPYESNPD